MTHSKAIVACFRWLFLALLLVAILIACSSPSQQLTKVVNTTNTDISLTTKINNSTELARLTPTLTTSITFTPASSLIPQKPAFSIVAQWNIENINDIAWLPDNTSFVVTFIENDIGGVRLYNTKSPYEIWSTNTGMAFGVTISPDGQRFAISPYFDFVQIRDIATGKVSVDFSNEKNCGADLNILFSPDGGTIITTRAGGGHGYPYETRISSWNTAKEKCIGEIIEDEGWLSDISINHDGKLIVLSLSRIAGKENNQVHIWDLHTKQIICEISGDFVEFSPVNNFFATVNWTNKDIELWDAENCTMIQKIGTDIQPTSLAFHPNSQLLASGGESIQIWDINSGELVSEMTGLPNEVQELSFSPDGRYLLSVSPGQSFGEKATLTLWEAIP